VWKRAAGEVRVTQDTRYPDDEMTKLTIDVDGPSAFALRLRVPG